MAAVFLAPSHETSQNMSTRRPLANVPNATNSPHRVGLVPAKRPRTANAAIDIPYGQPPPKKQIVNGAENETHASISTKTSTLQGTDSKLFARRSNNAQPSAFEKKLVAARDRERQSQTKSTKQEKVPAENISIRQWQRHYRKAFPHFVFYFDCVPIDVRSKCSRQVMALGAREEKFFSRLVTHVVTSRPIPPEIEKKPHTDLTHDAQHESTGDGAMSQTVNPAELEMHLHLAVCPKREQSQDVLHRAREMGMKIWAVEKLQRMITTINDVDIANSNSHLVRNNTGGSQTKSRGKDDLSQVLQNELSGPSDRNHLSVLKDLALFKGPFIYVHDMDEKTRPVMVREYPKVAKRQDGIWPQFRSAPLGKCPFIEERDTERQRARHEKEKKAFIKPAVPQRDAPVEIRHEDNEPPQPKKEPVPVDGEEPVVPPVQQEEEESPDVNQEILMSPKKSSESFIPPQLNRKGPFYHGREPAASGVQPSNITSAIRSQMVSSTAAAPGAKAGLSKEVHELKRKVLEKSNGGFASASFRPPDATTAANSVKTESSRLRKSNFPDKLGQIEEETIHPDGDANKCRANTQKAAEQRRKERRRDPKPGYCENCRDKFDDFEEHVMTRKHRKFAMNLTNWAELDSLLFQLQRPLKEEYDYV
ncbi:Dfp1/Him1, central region-domain-containing protein [Aspergillus egyptiacus]|nr:Dfp1/Him1, central region-domain-containing protein [Aspergillus egyptiacus]